MKAEFYTVMRTFKIVKKFAATEQVWSVQITGCLENQRFFYATAVVKKDCNVHFGFQQSALSKYIGN
jgi:hypothetical protein